MALAGSLKEFGLADILQLIFYQKKSGALTLKSRFDMVRVLFNEGNIVTAESAKRRVEGRLGRVLLRKGVVTAEALKAAMAEHKKTRKKLGHILIEHNLVTREEIQRVLTDQITELVVQLFGWKEGSYEFTPGAVPLDRAIPLSVDTQGLMMESLRIFDEWSVFQGKIEQGSVLTRTQKKPQGLSKDQTELLGYVDGKNDVHKVAALYGMDAFQTAKALVELMDMGLVENRLPVSGMEAEEVLEELEPVHIPGLSIIVSLIVIAALALSVVVMSRAGMNVNSFKAAEAVDTLRYKVEAEKADTGYYPRSLKDADPWGHLYVYETTGDGFVLYSAGPDGRAGTADDIY